ncbi:MAG: RNA methyltransferase [Betaproteobacteria bacterium]|nr:RNA methyltransferase [Betaproteobacteria bacterium]
MVPIETSPAHSLSHVRVVLVGTTHPGNIGSAARAMKTMGLTRLVLVAPRAFPHPEAEALASGAADLLAAAQVCATLEDAIGDATLAIAFSARHRDLSLPELDVRGAAALAVAEAQRGEVALVFGTESVGLSNEALLKCQRRAWIPTSDAYGSLNLAAAVQVAAYELNVAASQGVGRRSTEEDFEAASLDDVEALYVHLEQNLIQSGFLDPAQPRRLMERLRRLFGRARLEREEVNILRGILTAWDGLGRRRRR